MPVWRRRGRLTQWVSRDFFQSTSAHDPNRPSEVKIARSGTGTSANSDHCQNRSRHAGRSSPTSPRSSPCSRPPWCSTAAAPRSQQEADPRGDEGPEGRKGGATHPHSLGRSRRATTPDPANDAPAAATRRRRSLEVTTSWSRNARSAPQGARSAPPEASAPEPRPARPLGPSRAFPNADTHASARTRASSRRSRRPARPLPELEGRTPPPASRAGFARRLSPAAAREGGDGGELAGSA